MEINEVVTAVTGLTYGIFYVDLNSITKESEDLNKLVDLANKVYQKDMREAILKRFQESPKGFYGAYSDVKEAIISGKLEG